MDKKLIYKVERSKSNRAKCKGCKENIEKNVLRLIYLQKVEFLTFRPIFLKIFFQFFSAFSNDSHEFLTATNGRAIIPGVFLENIIHDRSLTSMDLPH